jgi:hypothetical protein
MVLLTAAGCVKALPATDTGDVSITSPTGPSAPVNPAPTPGSSPAPVASDQPLSYNQDLKPIFDSDCLPCHSNSRPLGRYSMSTYQNVLTAVRPGSASSLLVMTTQPRGSMYRYFSGNRTAKADLIRRWVVDFGAQQSR